MAEGKRDQAPGKHSISSCRPGGFQPRGCYALLCVTPWGVVRSRHTLWVASTADRSNGRGLVPAPEWVLGLAALGSLAVMTLPELAKSLPHPGQTRQAQYAATCLGTVVLSSGYAWAVARVHQQLDRSWVASTCIYATGLAIVKFIMSPISFDKSSEITLGEFVAAGLAVVPLYLAALGVVYVSASRQRGVWPSASKLRLAGLLALLAVATRFLVALVLGTASEYLESLAGAGLVLPVVIVVGSLAVMESFDRAGPLLKAALRVSVVIVVVQHAMWVVYMYRLFQ